MADVLVTVTYVDDDGTERTFEQSFEWNLEPDPQRRPRAPFVGLEGKIEAASREVALDLTLALDAELHAEDNRRARAIADHVQWVRLREAEGGQA